MACDDFLIMIKNVYDYKITNNVLDPMMVGETPTMASASYDGQ